MTNFQNSGNLISIYTLHYDSVKKALRKKGCKKLDFEDIYHDAFIVLMERQIDTGVIRNYNRSYLIRFCKNSWNKKLRKVLPFDFVDDKKLSHLTDSDSEEDLTPIAEKLINELSESSKKVLLLHAQGYTEKEIAAKLNLKDRNAVKNKKYYALNSIKNKLKNSNNTDS